MSCDPIFTARDSVVDKLKQAVDDQDEAVEDAAMAAVAMAGAEFAVVACAGALALGPYGLPAYLVCEGTALAALGAAGVAVAYYEEKVEDLTEKVSELQGALEQIDDALAHCQEAKSWQEMAVEKAIATAAGAADFADSVEWEPVDSGPLQEAENLVEEAESAAAEAELAAMEARSAEGYG
jgi:uncharacterized protein YukE